MTLVARWEMAGELSIRANSIAGIPGNGGLNWQQRWEEVGKSRDI